MAHSCDSDRVEDEELVDELRGIHSLTLVRFLILPRIARRRKSA
jgi:hypothetical protein